MANETVVMEFTPCSARRAQKRGGSTFRGQVENLRFREFPEVTSAGGAR